MNHLPIPANTICVDGRQWDISNLLLTTCHDNETFSTPSSPSTLNTSHRSSSLRRSTHNNNHEQTSIQSPEMNDDDVKIGAKKNQFCEEDEKEYEKEYYYSYEDCDGLLYPTDRPDTPPTVDEIFRRQPPQRRNISDFDILPYSSSHSNRSFAIPRNSSHDSDDDDCSALTFNDDGSVHDSQHSPALPQSPPVFIPSRPRPMVEVMPNQFLPLRGSDETLFYVEHGFCREARCDYCCTNQYFIQDVTMVMCPGCRLIFAPEALGNNNANNNNTTTSGSLGLGLRVDEADAIFRHQRQVRELRERRNRSPPPPPPAGGLQKQYSQTSFISAGMAAATTSAPNDRAAAAASTTARNLLMRRQASLSRFRGSQHSKRSAEGSRAA